MQSIPYFSPFQTASSYLTRRLNENPSIGHRIEHHSGEISSSEPSSDSSDNEGSDNKILRSHSVGSSSTRSSTPLLSHTSRGTTHSPNSISRRGSLPRSQSRASSYGPPGFLGGADNQYTPGVPFPVHKKARTSRTSSSSINSTVIHDLVSHSSQMIALMAKITESQLELARQREQRTAEQHRSQLLVQQAPVYQQIISNHTLPDQTREEACQALERLIRGN